MSERLHGPEAAAIFAAANRAALDADWSAERDAVWDDVLATLTGDQITPEEYDLLMAPWRSVSGDE